MRMLTSGRARASAWLLFCALSSACPGSEQASSASPSTAGGAGGLEASNAGLGGAGGMVPIAGAGSTGAPAAGSGGVGGTGVPVAGMSALPVGGDPSVQPPIGERVFDAGSDPARNQVQAGQVCARLAQIQCAGEAYCCDAPGRDRATCENVMREGCIAELFLDAISLNEVTAFDAAAAAATFEQLEQLAASCDTSIAAFGGSRSGLMGMFRGTIAEGDSCSPGATTDRAKAAAHLVACAGIDTIACLPSSILSWSCKPRGDVGAPCFTDVNCFDGLYCPNPTPTFGRHECTPRKQLGEACELPNECASLFCKAGACAEESVQNAYCLAQ